MAGSEGLQNNESIPSFHCVCAPVLAVLCAANFGWWKIKITKRDEELSVGPGLWLSPRCHHPVLALELSAPNLFYLDRVKHEDV